MDNYIPVAPSHRSSDNNLEKIECILQLIMGLQNDILGSYLARSAICFSEVANRIRILGLGTRQKREQLSQHGSSPRQRRDEVVHGHERSN